MTTPMRSRMRRQTRPAKYMSRACQADSASWGRPGRSSFSFTGEFPDMDDQQPVEASSRRRDYTASGRNTGAYRAVGQEDTQRMPPVNKYGVHYSAAIALFVVMIAIFAGLIGSELSARGRLETAIGDSRTAISQLNADCASLKDDISLESSDMIVRQRASGLGLTLSRDADVRMLEAPKNAHITLTEQVSLSPSLASIWGQ